MSKKTIELIPIIVQDPGNTTEILCKIVISDPQNMEQEVYSKEIKLCDLLKRNVVDEIFIYTDEETQEGLKKKLQELKNSLNKKEMIWRPKNIGWNQFNKEKIEFAFSNCHITEDGVDYNNHAQEKGFELCLSNSYKDTLEHAKTRFLENMNVLGREPEVLFPVFFVNVTSMIAYFMDACRRNVGISLWLDGKMGSGKTTVAQTVGNYLTAGLLDSFQGSRNEIMAFEKTKVVLELMHRCRSIPMILDDKKAEKASAQRDKVWNNIDILIRSVTNQYIAQFGKETGLSDEYKKEKFYSSVIITGEYLETYPSTIARLVYLDMGDFINNKNASNAIRKYQENPKLLADFMGHFCRFLCTKASDSKYWKERVLMWDDLWERNKGYFYGSNQSRFAQTMTALQLAARVIRDFSEYCHADETFDVEVFIQTADKIALKLMKATQQKVGGDILVLKDAFKEIINDGEFNIFLSPKVITEYQSRWSDLPYGLLEGVNALWIADVNRINNRAEANFDGMLYLDPNKGKDREPVCIVRLDWLTRLLKQKIEELIKRYNYKAMIQITNTKLRDAGIICGTMRKDETYNMQFKYPYIHMDNMVTNIVLETVDCVCLNLSNPLLNTMVKDLQQKDVEEKEIYVDDYKMWNNLMYFNNYDELNRQLRKSLDYLKNKS